MSDSCAHSEAVRLAGREDTPLNECQKDVAVVPLGLIWELNDSIDWPSDGWRPVTNRSL